MPPIDQFSFILGAIVTLITLWALSQVVGWFKGIFRPPSGMSIRQKIIGGLRRLIVALLILATLAMMGYIFYSVLIK